MKKIMAIAIAIVSIILALYTGIWVMFIGGILQIIEGIKSDPTNGGMIATGLLKWLFCGISEFIAIIGLVVAYLVAFGKSSPFPMLDRLMNKIMP